MINFSANDCEARTIQLMVERAEKLWGTMGHSLDRLSCTMDITATHLNGCPLKLQELLAADDFNFCHDVGGIMRHIDRRTGQLRDCFVPRFAVPQPPAQAAA